jgi:predicted dehydrogenase
VVFGEGYDKIGAFRRLVEDFCGDVRGEKPALIGTEDALASVAVVESAYESLRRNHWIPVNGQTGVATTTETPPPSSS